MTTFVETVLQAGARLATHVRSDQPDPKISLPLVECIDDPLKLQQIKKEWTCLETGLGTPLLSFNWLNSCANSFFKPGRLRIYLLRSGGKIRAICPLSLRGKFRKRLEILGSSITDEPGGILYSDRKSPEILLDSVLETRRTFYLKGLRLDSPETKALDGVIRKKKLKALVREERLPWVPTEGSWAEFEKSISSSRRSSLRRLQRMAESKGKVEFEAASPGPAELLTRLREVFDVEAASWKGRTGTAMKSYDKLGAFFRSYASEESREQNLRLFFLRVDGKAIAAQLTTIHQNRLWVFKIGHDESWSWCSPGVLLMHRVMQYCFDNHLDACELLGSDEPWLHIWGDETHSVVTYRIYHGTVGMIVDLGTDFFKMLSYKVQRRFAKRKGQKV